MEAEERRRKWAWIQANAPALAEFLRALAAAGMPPAESLRLRDRDGREVRP